MKENYYNKPVNPNFYSTLKITGENTDKPIRLLSKGEFLKGKSGYTLLSEDNKILFSDDRNKTIHQID